jgi:hypothetical protein
MCVHGLACVGTTWLSMAVIKGGPTKKEVILEKSACKWIDLESEEEVAAPHANVFTKVEMADAAGNAATWVVAAAVLKPVAAMKEESAQSESESEQPPKRMKMAVKAVGQYGVANPAVLMLE